MIIKFLKAIGKILIVIASIISATIDELRGIDHGEDETELDEKQKLFKKFRE